MKLRFATALVVLALGLLFGRGILLADTAVCLSDLPLRGSVQIDSFPTPHVATGIDIDPNNGELWISQGQASASPDPISTATKSAGVWTIEEAFSLGIDAQALDYDTRDGTLWHINATGAAQTYLYHLGKDGTVLYSKYIRHLVDDDDRNGDFQGITVDTSTGHIWLIGTYTVGDEPTIIRAYEVEVDELLDTVEIIGSFDSTLCSDFTMMRAIEYDPRNDTLWVSGKNASEELLLVECTKTGEWLQSIRLPSQLWGLEDIDDIGLDVRDGSFWLATAYNNEMIHIESCNYSIVGDLNLDCRVDFRDFALMVENWLLDCKQDPQASGCIPLP